MLCKESKEVRTLVTERDRAFHSTFPGIAGWAGTVPDIYPLSFDSHWWHSIGKCARLSQPSWLLLCNIIQSYLLTYLLWVMWVCHWTRSIRSYRRVFSDMTNIVWRHCECLWFWCHLQTFLLLPSVCWCCWFVGCSFMIAGFSLQCFCSTVGWCQQWHVATKSQNLDSS